MNVCNMYILTSASSLKTKRKKNVEIRTIDMKTKINGAPKLSQLSSVKFFY